MAVDPSHRYSNKSEKDNEDIYDDFKLKKPCGRDVYYKLNTALQGLNVLRLGLHLTRCDFVRILTNTVWWTSNVKKAHWTTDTYLPVNP